MNKISLLLQYGIDSDRVVWRFLGFLLSFYTHFLHFAFKMNPSGIIQGIPRGSDPPARFLPDEYSVDNSTLFSHTELSAHDAFTPTISLAGSPTKVHGNGISIYASENSDSNNESLRIAGPDYKDQTRHVALKPYEMVNLKNARQAQHPLQHSEIKVKTDASFSTSVPVAHAIPIQRLEKTSGSDRLLRSTMSNETVLITSSPIWDAENVDWGLDCTSMCTDDKHDQYRNHGRMSNVNRIGIVTSQFKNFGTAERDNELRDCIVDTFEPSVHDCGPAFSSATTVLLPAPMSPQRQRSLPNSTGEKEASCPTVHNQKHDLTNDKQCFDKEKRVEDDDSLLQQRHLEYAERKRMSETRLRLLFSREYEKKGMDSLCYNQKRQMQGKNQI